jgi:hypothetical protein
MSGTSIVIAFYAVKKDRWLVLMGGREFAGRVWPRFLLILCRDRVSSYPEAIYGSLGFSNPEGFLASTEEPISLVPSLFAALSQYRSDARLATVTTNFDLIQIYFYFLMNMLDYPDVEANLEQSAVEWYCSMAVITEETLNITTNYTYFVEEGRFHTLIIGDVFGNLTFDPFYETGLSSVRLADWTAQLIDPDGSLPAPVFVAPSVFPANVCGVSG